MLTGYCGGIQNKLHMLMSMLMVCGLVFLLGPDAKAGMHNGFEGGVLEAKILLTPPDITWGPWDSTVGPGIEYSIQQEFKSGFSTVPVDIDVSNKTIHFLYTVDVAANFAPGDFNGYIFSDINDYMTDILNVTVHPTDNTLGMTQDRVSFNKDQIFANVASLPFAPGKTFQLDIDFAAAPVPEPTTMALFGAGLAGLTVICRRKRN